MRILTEPQISYQEFPPDSRLTDYIKCYWHFNIETYSAIPFDILPDGYFDLLIIIKGNRIVDVKLTGIWSKAIAIQYSENTEIVGIRFKPLSIGRIFDFVLKNHINDSLQISLKDLKISEQVLLDALYSFPKFLVNYLDKHFLQRISLTTSDQRLARCFQMVDCSTGSASVSSIALNAGISQRQLHRLVTNMIGIGLKDYSKIVRFKKSLRDVKQNKANYSHYYDQSHFIHEVKQFTGLTPEKIDLNNDVRFLQYFDFAKE